MRTIALLCLTLAAPAAAQKYHTLDDLIADVVHTLDAQHVKGVVAVFPPLSSVDNENAGRVVNVFSAASDRIVRKLVDNLGEHHGLQSMAEGELTKAIEGVNRQGVFDGSPRGSHELGAALAKKYDVRWMVTGKLEVKTRTSPPVIVVQLTVYDLARGGFEQVKTLEARLDGKSLRRTKDQDLAKLVYEDSAYPLKGSAVGGAGHPTDPGGGPGPDAAVELENKVRELVADLRADLDRKKIDSNATAVVFPAWMRNLDDPDTPYVTELTRVVRDIVERALAPDSHGGGFADLLPWEKVQRKIDRGLGLPLSFFYLDDTPVDFMEALGLQGAIRITQEVVGGSVTLKFRYENWPFGDLVTVASRTMRIGEGFDRNAVDRWIANPRPERGKIADGDVFDALAKVSASAYAADFERALRKRLGITPAELTVMQERGMKVALFPIWEASTGTGAQAAITVSDLTEDLNDFFESALTERGFTVMGSDPLQRKLNDLNRRVGWFYGDPLDKRIQSELGLIAAMRVAYRERRGKVTLQVRLDVDDAEVNVGRDRVLGADKEREIREFVTKRVGAKKLLEEGDLVPSPEQEVYQSLQYHVDRVFAALAETNPGVLHEKKLIVGDVRIPFSASLREQLEQSVQELYRQIGRAEKLLVDAGVSGEDLSTSKLATPIAYGGVRFDTLEAAQRYVSMLKIQVTLSEPDSLERKLTQAMHDRISSKSHVPPQQLNLLGPAVRQLLAKSMEEATRRGGVRIRPVEQQFGDVLLRTAIHVRGKDVVITSKLLSMSDETQLTDTVETTVYRRMAESVGALVTSGKWDASAIRVK